MKKICVFAILAAFLAIPSFSNAVITNWVCDDDHDGTIVMGAQSWNYSEADEAYTLAMDCTHNGLLGTPELFGHIAGDFITDTELDPTVWIAETVDNSTNFAWTDYHITIGMTKTFSISTSVIAPDYWTYVVTQPTAGQIPNGGGTGWVGTIDYFMNPGGTPIAIGDSGDFGFKVSFLGSVAFCTEQVPTPEPATMALLGLGALVLRKKK